MRITVIAGNGMGGTEKAAYLYACELARRGHEVEALTAPDGYRSEMLLLAGVKIRNIEFNVDRLSLYFKEFQPQVVHNHTPGYTDHSILYSSLRSLGKTKPKLVETNVFGQLLDFSDKGDVDMRMFVSYTSGMQAFSRIRNIQGPPQSNKHTVLFNPLPTDAFEIDNEKRLEFRNSIGVNDNEFLAIRLGRPGSKWEAWECQAFQKARKVNPKLRLFLMEPKENLRHKIESGKYGDGIIIKTATADPQYLQMVYSAGDVMLQASSFGESYGYTLAEGMAAGLPIVTLSTPWGDQAQTELVKHGQTGYVCRTITGMALALSELSLYRLKSKAFGVAGRERIRSKSNLMHEMNLLEDIFAHLLHEKNSILMEQRFLDWQHFIKAKNEQRSIPSYEIENKLKVLLICSSLNEAYRRFRNFVKFVCLKIKGLPVYRL